MANLARTYCDCGAPVERDPVTGKQLYVIGSEAVCHRCRIMAHRRDESERVESKLIERDFIAHARHAVGWTCWGGVAL